MQLSMEFTEAHGRCSAASEACGNMVEHASSLFMQSVVSWKPLHHCSVVADKPLQHSIRSLSPVFYSVFFRVFGGKLLQE